MQYFLYSCDLIQDDSSRLLHSAQFSERLVWCTFSALQLHGCSAFSQYDLTYAARCGRNFWAYVISWKIPEGNTSAIDAWPGCLENNRTTQWDDDGIHGTLLSFVREYKGIKSCCITLISLITCHRFGVNLAIIAMNTFIVFVPRKDLVLLYNMARYM